MRHTGFGMAVAVMVLAIHTQAAAQMPPYQEEELTFASGSVTIAWTLTASAGREPFPAVVLLCGSGAQNRDSELAGFRIFRIIEDHLARRRRRPPVMMLIVTRGCPAPRCSEVRLWRKRRNTPR